MTLLVSYMPESRIETDAEALLDEFAKATDLYLMSRGLCVFSEIRI